MDTPNQSWLDSLKQYDRERSSFPGEHWLTLGLGAWLVLRGGKGSWLKRSLAVAAGGALVARSLSGRDGPLQRWSLDGAPGREVTVAGGDVVASTAELPLDGGATPPWPEDSQAEGRQAQEQLARERNAAWPF